MQQSNTISKQISSIKLFFKKEFDPHYIFNIARKTKLIQRSSSRIQGNELLNILLESALDPKIYPLEGLADGMQKYNSKARMSRQGLAQRINTEECVTFLLFTFKKCLGVIRDKISKEIISHTKFQKKLLLNKFKQIRVIDSTEFPIHHSLKSAFKGSGGPQENSSAMKICAILDLQSNCLIDAIVTDRREPDQCLGELLLPNLDACGLTMFDLGFFSIKLFKKISEKNAFFLSRLHGSANVYIEYNDEIAIDIGDFLAKKLRKKCFYSRHAYIGVEKFPVRIAAVKVSKSISDERKKEYRKRCRKDNRKPSERNLKRLEYDILISNLPEALVSDQDILNLYRLRWQIELMFKNWKSQLNIDFITGKNIYRIQVLILSRLITISILWMIAGVIEALLNRIFDYEKSMHKIINWFKRDCRYAKLILGYAKSIIEELLENPEYFRKENSPKKKTTRNRINQVASIKRFKLV